MGRPTAFTEEAGRAVLRALAVGCTQRTAAGCAGVDDTTVTRWRRRYPDFGAAAATAEATAERSMASVLFEAAMAGDWRAAEAWLKRRRPQEWGDKQQLEHSGAVDFETEIAAASVSLDRKLSRMLASSPCEPEGTG
jgi:hypothetical protein